MDWTLFFTTMGGTSAAVAATAFLARKLFELSFARALEEHKSLLRAQVDIETARFGTKFDWLHKEQADTALSLHRLLQQMQELYKSIIAEFEETGQYAPYAKYSELADYASQTASLFRMNRPILHQEVRELLDLFLSASSDAAFAIASDPEVQGAGNDPRISEDIDHAYLVLSEMLPALVKELDDVIVKACHPEPGD